MTDIMPIENIVKKIYLFRGQKVMLDSDLAKLYDVETKQLTRQVRRNIERFPKEFMFQLSVREREHLRCQIGASSWGGHRYLPYVFTEYGVAMLSSVLNSKKAIQINVMIIRSFIKIRELLSTHKKLAMKIAQLETKHDEQFVAVFNALKHLMKEPEREKVRIGFRV
jgi:phage regulator Rha-like protein